MPEIRVESAGRLDKTLVAHASGVSRSRLSEAIVAGQVTVNGEVRTKAGFAVVPGDVVSFSMPEDRPAHDLAPADIPLDILYEDDVLIVVNKPRGLATHPAPGLDEPTLVNALLGRGTALSEGSESFRPGIVHRLDKDTTGVIVVAKTDRAHAELAAQIAERSASREYVAVVEGQVREDPFRIEGPLGRDPKNPLKRAVVADGKPAVTHVTRLAFDGQDSVVRCTLETGRTHQIRVHLSAAGHPVRGDALYGDGVGPLQLHARRLTLRHPSTGEVVTWEAPFPEDFDAKNAQTTDRVV